VKGTYASANFAVGADASGHVLVTYAAAAADLLGWYDSEFPTIAETHSAVVGLGAGPQKGARRRLMPMRSAWPTRSHHPRLAAAANHERHRATPEPGFISTETRLGGPPWISASSPFGLHSPAGDRVSAGVRTRRLTFGRLPMDGTWLSYAEAAARLGLSIEAVRQRAIRNKWARTAGERQTCAHTPAR
jgi:hypothetical protein